MQQNYNMQVIIEGMKVGCIATETMDIIILRRKNKTGGIIICSDMHYNRGYNGLVLL